jgi:hypothetical protein
VEGRSCSLQFSRHITGQSNKDESASLFGPLAEEDAESLRRAHGHLVAPLPHDGRPVEMFRFLGREKLSLFSEQTRG